MNYDCDHKKWNLLFVYKGRIEDVMNKMNNYSIIVVVIWIYAKLKKRKRAYLVVCCGRDV